MSIAYRCTEVDRFTDAYTDGEFTDEERAAVDAHLGECSACAQKLRAQAAWKAAFKAAAPRPTVSPSLRARIGAALDAEQAAARRRGGRRLAWSMVPLAAAASLVGFFWVHRPANSPVVADVIARYQRDLPVDVRGGDQEVRQWFADKVSFAVRPPRLPHGALVGGRLANVGDRQAAYLVYDVGGQKVGVTVFDPSNVPIESQRCRRVADRAVCLDGQRGYHVALYRDDDVGYAITSAMDEEHMLQLVSSAVQR